MSKTSILRNGVSAFAAAFSIGSKRAESEDGEDNPHRQKDGESDGDFAKRCREDKDCPEARKQKAEETDEDYAKRMKKADAEDDGMDAEAEDDSPDDGEDEKKKEAAAVQRGVTAERTRWTAVLTSKAAKGKGVAACHFLASTDMSPAQLQEVLGAMPGDGDSRTGLAARMRDNAVTAPGQDAAPEKPSASGAVTGDMVARAAAKARGEQRA